MFFSKVFHTFITFVSYIINCRKHQVFLNLIFFFFIRAGAKAPASFHFWGKYPVYKVNCESRIPITRGDLNIYIPKSSEHIYPQDKLTVVGTDTQLQEFRNRIEDVKSTSDTDAVDKKITLHSFTVDEEFRFLNQTIAQSHLGEKHDEYCCSH